MVIAPLLMATELSDFIPLALDVSEEFPLPDDAESFVTSAEASLSADILRPPPPQLPQSPLKPPSFFTLAF